MDYKIHIAYGFHVNCYHSYRGDTNDNLGFGSDIRIICTGCGRDMTVPREKLEKAIKKIHHEKETAND